MFARRFVFAAALAVVGVLAAPPTSQAAFLLKLESGGQSATIDLAALSTGGPGGPGPGPNGYTYTFFFKENVDGTTTATFTNLEFAGYTISSSTNITNQPGALAGGNLSLNGLTVSRDTGGASANDLKISLTATGYTLPGVQKDLDSNFAARLNTLAQTIPTVAFQSSFDSTDTAFGATTSNTATTAGSNFGPVAPQTPFSAVGLSALNSSAATYSLTNVVTITGLGFGVPNRLDQGGASSLVTPSSGQFSTVPAPAGLILIAGAVPFLALLRRRRAAAPEVASAA